MEGERVYVGKTFRIRFTGGDYVPPRNTRGISYDNDERSRGSRIMNGFVVTFVCIPSSFCGRFRCVFHRLLGLTRGYRRRGSVSRIGQRSDLTRRASYDYRYCFDRNGRRGTRFRFGQIVCYVRGHANRDVRYYVRVFILVVVVFGVCFLNDAIRKYENVYATRPPPRIPPLHVYIYIRVRARRRLRWIDRVVIIHGKLYDARRPEKTAVRIFRVSGGTNDNDNKVFVRASTAESRESFKNYVTA